MRLEGRSKAGFYPTPAHIMDKIVSYLKCDHPARCRLLDPCCGAGDPLEKIAGAFDITESYGVELDKERAEVSQKRLKKVIAGSYTFLRAPEKSFSLLFLNPPYDTDAEFKRLEHQFLVDTTRYLAQGGVLVYIIPHDRLIDRTARYLSYWYRDIKVFRFPDKDYETFKQIVIFGVKKDKYRADEKLEDELKQIAYVTKESVPVIQESRPCYSLPEVKGKFWFASKFLNPDECQREIEEYGLWRDGAIKDLLFPEATETLKPLMPLRKGHLAMLIGAGLMDNLEVRKGAKRLLIKGKTEKKVNCQDVEENGERTITETDYVVTNVMALDLNNGTVMTIQ